MSTGVTTLRRYERKRPWAHWVALCIVALMVYLSFTTAEWDFTSLTDPVARGRAMDRAWALFVSFTSPDLSGEWLDECLELTLQTLAAATLGTAVAVVLAFVLAMGASRAVMVGEEKSPRWLRWFPLRSPAAAFCSLCRLILDTLRAVPDFAWAVILVVVVGLGPLAGALALALNVTGILGKVYSEFWDNVDPKQYEQLRALGTGRLGTFFYGIRPLASRSVQSFTLMRAECAIRNAAVIGAVGGGGLGAEIMYQIGFGAWAKVSTLMLFTLALTFSADMAGNFIRRQLRSDPNHPRAHKSQGTLASLSRSYIGAGFAGLVVVWSVWFMGWGNSAGYEGSTVNFMKPATELLGVQGWKNLAFFERLLSPDLDMSAWGDDPVWSIDWNPFPSDEGAAGRYMYKLENTPIDMTARYGISDVFNGDAWSAWNEELSKWFVWRVIKSAASPLAMAVIGTLLGVLMAILLTYPHSIAFQLESSQFTGESPPLWLRGLRGLQLVLARLVGLVARGVPEVMWAFLFISFFAPGLLAGAIAIALHSCGVLVRVFSETVDNIPYRRFEQSFMGSRMTCFACAAAPVSARDWMTYGFFQFESNVRMGVVLGIIGVPGLGFFFTFQFEWFQYEKAATYLLVMIGLTVLIDRISRALKLSRVG